MSEIVSQWSWLFNKNKLSGSAIMWTCCKGHNIRNVRDGQGPEVWRFQVTRYDIWNTLLKLFKYPQQTYDKIIEFRRKMLNYADGKSNTHAHCPLHITSNVQSCMKPCSSPKWYGWSTISCQLVHG